MINEHNIEAFLLDYAEGRLSAEQVTALMVYLAQHPEWQLLDELPSLRPETAESVDFSFLKKNNVFVPSELTLENEHPYDLMAVAAVENLLTSDEKVKLNREVKQNPSFEKQLSTYQSTVLKSELEVVFPNPKVLKHKGGRTIPLTLIGLSSAAAIAFFIWIKTQPSAPNFIGKKPIEKEQNDTLNTRPNTRPKTQETPDFVAKDLTKKSPIKFIPEQKQENEILPIPNIAETPTPKIDLLPENDAQKEDLALQPEQTPENVQLPSANNSDYAALPTLTPKEFFVRKSNEFIFGNPAPSDEEKLSSFSKAVASTTGMDFEVRRSQKGSASTFFLKLGFFSIERKKSV